MPSDTDPNAFILKTRPFHTTIEAIAKDKARERQNRPSDVFSLTHATIDDGTGILSRIHEKSMRAIVVHARDAACMRPKPYSARILAIRMMGHPPLSPSLSLSHTAKNRATHAVPPNPLIILG